MENKEIAVISNRKYNQENLFILPGTTERNLQLFSELVSCVCDIFFWTYNCDMTLLKTNCPNPETMSLFFSLEEQQALEEVRLGMERPLPVILSNSLHMIWIADFEEVSGQMRYTHVIGPVFTEEIPLENIRQELMHKHLSDTAQQEFMALLEGLPVVLLTRFMEYGLMLHYCITKQRISVSEIIYPNSSKQKHPDGSMEVSSDIHGTWAMEQQMMRMMEEGNPEYINFAGRMASQGGMGHIGGGDSIRELKNYVIVHIILCRLSAVRGGLSPEIAYTLSDQYINGVEGCRTISEIAEVNAAMQKDYLTRVRKCRMKQGVSSQILKCMDYIQLHLSEKISLHRLAEWTGYADTYLSRKFHAETGQTISEYILSCRIERAKDLLISSDQTVQEICELLGFSGPSHFSEQFRRAVGMTPGEYRSHGRLGQ